MTNISDEEEGDWDITPDGLYVATRRFLMKRGYCCANQCRNCPYINWRNKPEWQPVAHQYVQTTRVSLKATDAAQTLYRYHKELGEHVAHVEHVEHVEHVAQEASQEEEWHKQMASHYAFLLKMWKKE